MLFGDKYEERKTMKLGDKYKRRGASDVVRVVATTDVSAVLYENYYGFRALMTLERFVNSFEPVPDEPVTVKPGTFEWAMMQVKAQKIVHRTEWPADTRLSLFIGKIKLLTGSDAKPNVQPYVVTVPDACSTDWEISD